MPPPVPPRTRRRGRGEGSIIQRPDGLWRARLSLGVDGLGRRMTRDVYGKTKAEVMAKLEELKGKARIGQVSSPSSLTVGQFLDQWLAAVESKTAVRTYEERESHVRVHLKPQLGAMKLATLHALQIEQFYAALAKAKVGKTAIRSAAITLSTALNYAVKIRLLPANPAAATQKPIAPVREMLCLTTEQGKILLAHCGDSTAGVLIAVALTSGARQGELLALRWDDILDRKLRIRRSLSFGNKGPQVKEPKTKASRRDVTIPPPTVALLERHRERAKKLNLLDKPVFCTAKGGYLERRNVLRALRGIISRVNTSSALKLPPKLRFHDLRHTMASVLLSRRNSLKAVSQRLGHANPAITLRVYAHVMPTDDAALSEEIGAAFA